MSRPRRSDPRKRLGLEPEADENQANTPSKKIKQEELERSSPGQSNANIRPRRSRCPTPHRSSLVGTPEEPQNQHKASETAHTDEQQIVAAEEMKHVPEQVEDPTPNLEPEQQQNPELVEIQTNETDQVLLEFKEALADKNFNDVVFVTSDGSEIPTYRCLISRHTNQFDETLRTATPVTIHIPDFTAEVVQAAIDFMLSNENPLMKTELSLLQFSKTYGFLRLENACSQNYDINPSNIFDTTQIAYTRDFEFLKQRCKNFLLDMLASNNGKEIEILKFAAECKIPDLMAACSLAVMKIVNSSNVCDIVKIAYENDLEELKQACLKILADKK